MPSGRWIDSILMTSAPNAANECVAAGPAQNAVKSTTRTPASGSPAACRACHGFPWLPDRVAVGVSRPRAPGAPAPGAATDISHGARGCRNPAGLSTYTPRCLQVIHVRDRRAVAERGQRQPEQLAEFDDLLDGALAHPRVDPLADPVAVVPSPDLESQLRNLGELRAVDHRGEVQPLLPRDHADADVAVLGGFDRRHLDRAPDRRPCSSCECSHSLLCINVIASSIDMSRCPPGPPRADATAQRQRAVGGPAAAHVLPQLAADRDRRARGIAAETGAARTSACRVNSVAGRSDHGPVQPKSEIVTTTQSGAGLEQPLGIDAARGRRGPVRGDDHDVGAGQQISRKRLSRCASRRSDS